MDWTQLKSKLYYEDGSYRDIFVLNVGIGEWKKWVELVNEKYQVQFFDSRIGRVTNVLNLEAIVETWTEEERELVTASIFLGAVKLDCCFYGAAEIEHNIDPKEFVSLEDHRGLVDYLVDISSSLNKEVVLRDDGREATLLAVKDGQLTMNCG